MKIISINLEGTDKFVSANLEHSDKATPGVAFNLDRPLSPRAKKKLTSRLSQFLSIKVNENCLCLTVTNKKGEPIHSTTVEDINKTLKTIEEEETGVLQARKTALEAIAKKTKLDFDKPLESLQQ
jgi:hypothetical protein